MFRKKKYVDEDDRFNLPLTVLRNTNIFIPNCFRAFFQRAVHTVLMIDVRTAGSYLDPPGSNTGYLSVRMAKFQNFEIKIILDVLRESTSRFF